MFYFKISSFLGWQDYQATGATDLVEAFESTMYERTFLSSAYLNTSNGLLNTAGMGKHITDWMPDKSESDETVQRGEFTASGHMSVSIGFAARGVEMLGTMLGNATYMAEAEALKGAMMKYMWNGTQFCDGICSEVEGHSLLMTNMFYLAFGLLPTADASAAAWRTTEEWGLEGIGDYGAFFYQAALAGGYYANGPYAPFDTPGDGSAMLTALTKCDLDSWCSGIRDDNLTMTRESWHDGTYSHQWGTSAVAGAVWGILGVHQTAPAFATVTVNPKLGACACVLFCSLFLLHRCTHLSRAGLRVA